MHTSFTPAPTDLRSPIRSSLATTTTTNTITNTTTNATTITTPFAPCVVPTYSDSNAPVVFTRNRRTTFGPGEKEVWHDLQRHNAKNFGLSISLLITQTINDPRTPFYGCGFELLNNHAIKDLEWPLGTLPPIKSTTKHRLLMWKLFEDVDDHVRNSRGNAALRKPVSIYTRWIFNHPEYQALTGFTESVIRRQLGEYRASRSLAKAPPTLDIEPPVPSKIEQSASNGVSTQAWLPEREAASFAPSSDAVVSVLGDQARPGPAKANDDNTPRPDDFSRFVWPDIDDLSGIDPDEFDCYVGHASARI